MYFYGIKAESRSTILLFRTVQRLVLPKSSNMNLDTSTETKLLIIPTRDVEDFEIMEREEEISEMVMNNI